MSCYFFLLFGEPNSTIKELLDEVRYQLWIQERKRIPFMRISQQLQYRKTLIEGLKLLAEEEKLHMCTLHLSVYLLDIFMDQHNIEIDKLHLVMLVCYLIAVKLEEADNKKPQIPSLNHLVKNKYKLDDFLRLERLMLVFFKFDVMFATPAHFVNYYIFVVFTEEDLANDLRHQVDILKEALRHANDFLYAVVDDVDMFQSSPSLICAAVLAAVRIKMCLKTKWPKELERVTTCSWNKIKPYVQKLLDSKTKE